MTISFFAYHRDPDLRRSVVDRIANLIANDRLANAARTDAGAGRICLISGLGDGTSDIAIAHRNTGFPAPLLYLAEAIFEGLPPEDAPHFAIALVRSAAIDGELSDIAPEFLKGMLEEAVAELGPSRIRSTAREAGHMFAELVQAADRQKAKALERQARRHGQELPTPNEVLVTQVLGAALDQFHTHLLPAVHWIARLYEPPSERYRQYARRLLELIEAA